MDTYTIKLKSLLRVMTRSLLIIKLLEVVAVIGISIATNKITDNSPVFWTYLLVILVIFYFIFTVLQFSYLLIPETFSEELKARSELKEIKIDLARKTEIYNYVAEAIGNLNEQTCQLSLTSAQLQEMEVLEPRENSFCSNDLVNNVAGAISPLIKNTNYIFQCNKTKYTIGLHINFFYKNPDFTNLPINTDDLVDNGALFIKDDYHLQEEIGKTILTDSQASDFRLSVRHALEASIFNSKYHHAVLQRNGKEFSMFVINIPEVCENGESLGGLFFITENITEPSDIAQVLRLFAKIISNLLSKQFECITRRVEEANKQHSQTSNTSAQIPPEVLAPEQCQPENSSN